MQQSVSFTCVVDSTLKQSNLPGLTLTGHKSMGRGFAKWIGRAVGTAGLKHKTELEDLPAYKLRVLQRGFCFSYWVSHHISHTSQQDWHLLCQLSR